MAWCFIAPSHYLNQCWLTNVSLPWVNFLNKINHTDSRFDHVIWQANLVVYYTPRHSLTATPPRPLWQQKVHLVNWEGGYCGSHLVQWNLNNMADQTMVTFSSAFQVHVLKRYTLILIKCSLKFVPQLLIHKTSLLFQVKADNLMVRKTKYSLPKHITMMIFLFILEY